MADMPASEMPRESLWLHFFWIEHQECIKNGDKDVKFANVDKRVVEASQLLTEWTLPKGDRNP